MRYAVANDLAQRNPVAEIRPADILKPRKTPAATSNSPTRGQVKIPHLTTAGAVSVYAV